MKGVVVYFRRRYNAVDPEPSYREDFYRHSTEEAAIEWLLRLSDGPNFATTLDFYSDPDEPKYGLVWESMAEGKLECWYMKRGVGVLWKAKIRALVDAPEVQTDYEIGDSNPDHGDLAEKTNE